MENNQIELLNDEEISRKIYTIHGVQVMMDEDLALLYGIETKYFNRAVKRNIERFPEEFMFQITNEEWESLRCQIGTSNNNDNLKSQIVTSGEQRGKHRKYLPYLFTEQGVAMLSAVLRSGIAVKVSIQIINAFVAMRRFLSSNAQIFQRLNKIELKQIETDKKNEDVFNAIERKDVQPRQGIFFDGQIFDAYKFVSDIIRSARESIILIDNYIDETVLTHFSKRKKNVKLTILTKTISAQLSLDMKKFSDQYPPVEIKEFKQSHDRFIIIDNKTVYHFGASLKDLGKKWFAFSKMDIGALDMLVRLEKVK